jgi:hypothetical protein
MARRKLKASALRRLHRSIGAAAAVFVLFIVMSGIAINHSNDLGLDRKHVSQSFLLDWYGLGAPARLVSFACGDAWLSFAGSQLYLDEKPVATVSGGVGAVSSGELLIAAGADELLLLDDDGNLVERQPWAGVDAASIESIGLDANDGVLVKSGGRIWSADVDLLNWRLADDTAAVTANWATPAPANGDLQQAIAQAYRGQGPSLEQLLLDLHSGRFFGTAGVIVYDLLALALGFLALSGLMLWWRSRRNGKSK